MAIRAIGFDFGETLATYRDTPLNWASLYRPALDRVATALGLTPSETAFARAEEVLRQFNTRLNPRTREVAADEIFRTALVEWGPVSTDSTRTAVAAFFGFFQQSLQPYPETLSALECLRGCGLRLGVLTDVPYGMPRRFVENDLQQSGIEPWIDVLLTSVDVGFRKPAPDGFRALAKALDVGLDEMIYVGNEPKDIAGANSAPMVSVLIDRGRSAPVWHGVERGGPRAIVTQLTQLPELLQA